MLVVHMLLCLLLLLGLTQAGRVAWQCCLGLLFVLLMVHELLQSQKAQRIWAIRRSSCSVRSSINSTLSIT